MRYLIVHPKIASRGGFYEFPLGLAYVSSSMKKAGFDTTCVNLCHDDRPVQEQVAEAIGKWRIDVLCTGGMSLHFAEIQAIFAAAREAKSDILTVAGGAIVTSDPELSAELLQFDFGVIGEGECTMVELADALEKKCDVATVQGLICAVEGHGDLAPDRLKQRKYLKTLPRGENCRLDDLPFPDYEGFGYDEYLRMLSPTSISAFLTARDVPRNASIITSRSCPYLCTFCYHPLGRKYRQRSMDNVFLEIDHLIARYGINMLFVHDELFALKKDRVLEFCTRIRERGVLWCASLRVTDVDRALLQTMRDSGCYAIGYGVESMSPRVLESMKKKITVAETEKAIAITREVGIGILANLIFGDPQEDQQTVAETLHWLRSHKDLGLWLSMIRVLPDSEIYRFALEKGLIRDKAQFVRDGFPIINISKLSPRQFRKLTSFIYWYGYGCDPSLVPVGRVLDSREAEADGWGRPSFTATIRCPSCAAETTYRNLTQESIWSLRGYTHFFCRSCWQKVFAATREVFRDNYRLRSGNVLNGLLLNGINLICHSRAAFTTLNTVRMTFAGDKRVLRLFSSLGRSERRGS